MTPKKLTLKELRQLIRETLDMEEMKLGLDEEGEPGRARYHDDEDEDDDKTDASVSDEEGTLSIDEEPLSGPFESRYDEEDELDELDSRFDPIGPKHHFDSRDDLDEYGAVGTDADVMDRHLAEDGSFGSDNMGVGSANPIEGQEYDEEDEDDVDEMGGPVGMGKGPGWL